MVWARWSGCRVGREVWGKRDSDERKPGLTGCVTTIWVPTLIGGYYWGLSLGHLPYPVGLSVTKFKLKTSCRTNNNWVGVLNPHNWETPDRLSVEDICLFKTDVLLVPPFHSRPLLFLSFLL